MSHGTPPFGPDSQTQGGAGVVALPLPLPQDAVYQILLRLSAKDICRFRAVCRPWRSLLSDPQFVADHAARHPSPPLVVAGYHPAYRDDGVLCDIVDLSGNVVRRVRAEWDECVISVNLDFVCISKGLSSSIRLFNMTTGAVFSLPQGLAEEHAGDERDILDYTSVAALGQVASTGEYKVLRVLHRASYANPEHLCEVFTFDGSDHARWRGKNAPPNPVSMGRWRSVAVNSIVYFFGQGSTSLMQSCSYLPSTLREKNGGRVSGDLITNISMPMSPQWLP